MPEMQGARRIMSGKGGLNEKDNQGVGGDFAGESFSLLDGLDDTERCYRKNQSQLF